MAIDLHYNALKRLVTRRNHIKTCATVEREARGDCEHDQGSIGAAGPGNVATPFELVAEPSPAAADLDVEAGCAPTRAHLRIRLNLTQGCGEEVTVVSFIVLGC